MIAIRYAARLLALGFGLLLTARLLAAYGDIWDPLARVSPGIVEWLGWIALILAGIFIIAIAFEWMTEGIVGDRGRR